MIRPELPSAAVVIPAAGMGARLGGAKKQFRRLGGKPLLVQTALRFEKHPRVEAIAIAVPMEEVDAVKSTCRRHNLSKVVSVVPGGSTRQESVRAGLASLSPTIEAVLVHDAVRPFVASTEIDNLLAALIDHDAASLAAPIVDTLCRAADTMVLERVDRDGVFRLLTPQAFRRDVLSRGHAKAGTEGMKYTDDVTLVMAMGIAVTLIPCVSPNIKITTLADWEQALLMWPGWENAEQS